MNSGICFTFYQMTLCIAWTMISQDVRLSVHPVSRAAIVSKWLKHIIKLFHQRIHIPHDSNFFPFQKLWQ